MRFSLPVVILFLFSACLTKPECLPTATNDVKISLRKIAGNTAKKVLFSSITVSGTPAVFVGKDSVTSLILPVNPHTDSTTFTFHYQTKVNSVVIDKIDYVTLKYTSQVAMISPDCGIFNYFYNLSVSSYSFEIPPRVVVGTLSTNANVTVNLEIKL